MGDQSKLERWATAYGRFITSVATNNSDEVLAYISGELSEVEVDFEHGFRFEGTDSNRATVISLLYLAADGVEFVGDASTPLAYGQWRINCEEPNPSFEVGNYGIQFALSSLGSIDSGVIFSETFLYCTHSVDFDLKGATVIDCGAFVGDTALFFAKQGATVYAVEPYPKNIQVLTQNLELNPELASRICVCEHAIGPDGTLVFDIIDDTIDGGGRVLDKRGSDTLQSVSVDCLTLSSFLQRNNITRAELAKLDIKGRELDLLAQEDLSCFRNVHIEYHLQQSEHVTVDSLLDKLTSMGFCSRVAKHNVAYYPLRSHGSIYAFNSSW